MWEVIYKTQIPWAELEALQDSLILNVKKNPQTRYLLFSEPLPTFTYGRNADSTDLIWHERDLKRNSVHVAPVSRGGKWTYHGPGQIVCYPIADLASLGFSQKEAKYFVNQLRASVLEMLLSFGVTAMGQDDPYGVFIGRKKLASFGMSFEGGVSQHGVALYLSSQQHYFSGIHACGSADTEFTCLEDYVPPIPWHVASRALSDFVEKGFKNP